MRVTLEIYLRLTILAIGSLLAVRPAIATELTDVATAAFDRHVQSAELRMNSEELPGGHFLHVDSLALASRNDAHSKLQNGEVVTEQIAGNDGEGAFKAPGAMLHHWLGTVWIPGATLNQVLEVVQDYNRHSEYYQPQVQKSKLTKHSHDNYTIYLRLMQKNVITVVFDTEHEVHYAHIDARHAVSHSHATRIAEVADPGKPTEHELTSADDHGFLWRLESYWRFFDTGRGVYIQCEAISLSRDVPFGLNWIVGPFIESVPRESLEFTLAATRKAVLARAPHSVSDAPPVQMRFANKEAR